MGTNYYLVKNICECCGRGDERLHIGKSSFGWCFSLHVDDDIKTLADWVRLFKDASCKIEDEYGERLSSEEMMDVITKRSHSGGFKDVPACYESWDEFHRMNHSVFGPNGLLRHTVDGSHCIGNGEGTWDLITGDFS